MNILESCFGKTRDGNIAKLYSLRNSNGMIVNITNYGGIISQIYTADRNGNAENVCLGFNSIEDYQNNPAYFGALIGRYANRISRGTFKINETHFQLSKNDGENHLHGGHTGFDKKLWSAKHYCTPSTATLELHYLSVDGEEGYPGNCSVTALYELNESNELTLTFQAKCDRSTPINLTQHSYFNLRGNGNALQHKININAEYYCPISEEHIPTGEILPVSGSPLDLRKPKTLLALINQNHDQLIIGKGFNHFFFIENNKSTHETGLNLAARVFEPESGRALEIYTQEPGIQFYSSGFLNEDINKKALGYGPYSGLCFEPQHCPDSLNSPSLPSTILHPGKLYTSKTCYRFLTAG